MPGLQAVAVSAIAVGLTVVALVVTWTVYGSGRVDWLAARARLQPIPKLLANGWYVDQLYARVIVGPGVAAARLLAWVDERAVDGLVNATGRGVRLLADRGRRLQTGFVREYALVVVAGAVGILVYLGFRL